MPLFNAVKKDHPEIVGYPSMEGGVKLAAGWLIERSGGDGDWSKDGKPSVRSRSECHSETAGFNHAAVFG